jgi:hypothetical protein
MYTSATMGPTNKIKKLSYETQKNVRWPCRAGLNQMKLTQTQFVLYDRPEAAHDNPRRRKEGEVPIWVTARG